MLSLSQKVIVITGGAGRIGSAFAEGIARAGGIAVIAEVDTKRALEVQEYIQNNVKNAIVEVICLDITSAQSIDNAIQFLDKKYGRIDGLVNNAYPKSKNFGRKFFDINYEDFCAFTNLHLGGYFNISQKFIAYFLKKNGGNIVNISSIQGVVAPAFETYEGTAMHSPVEYTVVKTGLIGLTRYLAKMFKKDNIRVNAISPGGILDSQPEIFLEQYKKRCGNKGMLDAQDIVGTLVYLLSDASKYVNGQTLVVDDGFVL